MTAATIPRGPERINLDFGGRTVALSNLNKVFWPKTGRTKGDLLRFYASISDALLPHLVQRAMVMKRYPNGIEGTFFFMKRTPDHRPDWLQTCSIEHSSGSVIEFPVVQDLASLLWIVNLGCIDLNQWYARCDDVHRPDYLHFDLDPVEGNRPVPFERVREVALRLRESLEALGMNSFVKTTGSRGLHVYVPIRRGPTQKEVWRVAKSIALLMAEKHPKEITAEYRIAKRPAGRVLIDYNQNAWGRTLASVYSVRPRPLATVATPITWDEVANGIEISDFTIDNVPERVKREGDLWRPLTYERRGCFALDELLAASR